MLLNTLFIALRSIRRNLLRSFLTILGIVIGVAAVITMVTLGNGATQAVQTKIASLGSNLLMVRPGQRQGPGGAGGGSVPSFKEADAEAILTQIGGVAAVAPEGRSSVTVIANCRNWATTVTGSSNAWFQTGNWTLAAGRQFTNDEQVSGAAVCVIGETVRRELYGGAVGYLSFAGDMDVAIAIRTGVIKDQTLYVQAGAGVVADSVPEMEWKETEVKMRAVIRAAELVEEGF